MSIHIGIIHIHIDISVVFVLGLLVLIPIFQFVTASLHDSSIKKGNVFFSDHELKNEWINITYYRNTPFWISISNRWRKLRYLEDNWILTGLDRFIFLRWRRLKYLKKQWALLPDSLKKTMRWRTIFLRLSLICLVLPILIAFICAERTIG